MLRALSGLLVVVVLATGSAAGAQPRRGPGDEPLLHVGPRAATGAVVTFGEAAPELEVDESEMTLRLRGVALALSAQELARLRRAIPGNAPKTASTEHAQTLYVLTLTAPGLDRSKRVRILRSPEGVIIGAEEGADGSPGSGKVSIPLESERIVELIRSWPAYRGGFSSSAAAVGPAPGEVAELAGPYEPGAFTLDERTARERIAGRGARVEGTKRVLAGETFFIRLPEGYTPRRPAGLLVFVDPSPSGRPPAPLHLAADELGFIVVGAAGAGNDRPWVDRVQLALDGAATAMARYHVDPRRVYAVGMSGGGRVASMLWAGFPEVFRGAVAIVGVNTYQHLPAGPGRAWRAGFARPTGERWARLRRQRLAAITGARDGNQAHTLAAIGHMRADGLAVEVFDYPDLGHEYPSPQRFLGALRWVDEPARAAVEAEAAAAAELLAKFKQAEGGGRMDAAARRRALVEVTRAGPWSEAAWEAAALLGLDPEIDGAD